MSARAAQAEAPRAEEGSAGAAPPVARHWPEYLMEALELGAFLVSACLFSTLLEHPASPVHRALPSPLLRGALMGVAMGATLIGIVYSPWGKQSGAHLNPFVTITFWRLGKVRGLDALAYVGAQFAGGLAGVLAAAALLPGLLADPHVRYGATVPGAPGLAGAVAAFAAEAAMAGFLMLVVLATASHPRLGRWTGVMSGACVAAYIALLAPVSGMSLNPARSLASALPSGELAPLWIYFSAPLLGMQAAAALHVRVRGAGSVACAKLHHWNGRRCIFCESRRRMGAGRT